MTKRTFCLFLKKTYWTGWPYPVYKLGWNTIPFTFSKWKNVNWMASHPIYILKKNCKPDMEYEVCLLQRKFTVDGNSIIKLTTLIITTTHKLLINIKIFLLFTCLKLLFRLKQIGSFSSQIYDVVVADSYPHAQMLTVNVKNRYNDFIIYHLRTYLYFLLEYGGGGWEYWGGERIRLKAIQIRVLGNFFHGPCE